MNKRKYVSKNTDSNAKKLYSLMKLSIATGSLYVVLLTTGFTSAIKSKPNVDNSTKGNVEITKEEPENVDYIDELDVETIPSQFDDFERVISYRSGIVNNASDVPYFDMKLNPREFAAYLGDENIMFEDLKAVVEKNTNLDQKTKHMINDRLGFADTEFQGDELYLAALKHNLTNLKIEYSSIEDICEFDPVECCLYINESLKDNDEAYMYALTKGVFGYATIEAYAHIDGERVLCSTYELYKTEEQIIDNGVLYKTGDKIYKLGQTFDNGFAEVITARLLSNKVVDCNNPLVKNRDDAWVFAILNSGIYKNKIGEYMNYGFENLVYAYEASPFANIGREMLNYDLPNWLDGVKFRATINILDAYLERYNSPEGVALIPGNYTYEQRADAFRERIRDCLIFPEFGIDRSLDGNGITDDLIKTIMDQHIANLCEKSLKSK